MTTPELVTITKPDDWHLHLRDEIALETTVPATSRVFGRAIVMPNLKPPVTTVKMALDYRARILEYKPLNSNFNPLMTLFLTDNLDPDEAVRLSTEESVVAIKYYPSGATTNSDTGVTDIKNVYPVVEKMAELGIPLLLHGEVTEDHIDIFDREKVFIDTILAPLIERYPELKVILEHITTKDSVEFVESQSSNVAATITIHHLLYNRNDMLVGGIRPHLYCLPVLKRNIHQASLVKAALSGSPKFFLGTDSAPHTKPEKETSCGCAGVFSAPAAIELYTQFFMEQNSLSKLEGFASFFGADFYGQPRNKEKITLEFKPWRMPDQYQLGDVPTVPIFAGQTINWRLKDDIEK